MQDFFNNFFDRPYRTLQYPAKNFAKSVEVRNDSYTLMIRKFMKGVSSEMINIVIKEHSIPEEEALDFIEFMINCDNKRKSEVEDIVEKCYKDGNSKIECAKTLLDKYYKITRVNVYKDKSEQEEITGVNEGIKDVLKPKSEEDIIKSTQHLTPQKKFEKGIKNGILSLVKIGVENGANINVKIKNYDEDDFFIPVRDWVLPIEMAKDKKYNDIVDYLNNLNNLNNLNKTNESIKDVLKPKSEDDINKEIEKLEPYDLLYKSVIKGYLPGIKMAIDKGVDLDEFGVLEMAAGEGSLDVVKYLISITDIPEDMSTILQIAFENNNNEIMDYLIKLYMDKYNDIKKLIEYADKNDYDELRWTYLNKFDKVTESVQTEVQKPNASLSLFMNFITRLKELKVKFIFDTKLINGIPNSLNTEGYNFYTESKPMNNKDVEFEFKYSRMLSSILKSFDMFKHITNDISFYIGIDKSNFLNFGYIINDQRIKIGFLKYRTMDIQKISDMIESTDKSIDFKVLSKRFASTLSIIQYYKGIFHSYLHNYDDDIEVYTSIVDDRFVVIIESIDPDVINKKYLSGIVNSNVFYVLPVQYEWDINTTKINNKLYYYFTIKK